MFFGVLFRDSFFGAKKAPPEAAQIGENATPAAAAARFSLFHWVAEITTFGFHFGGVLGTKFATILLYGRPGT